MKSTEKSLYDTYHRESEVLRENPITMEQFLNESPDVTKIIIKAMNERSIEVSVPFSRWCCTHGWVIDNNNQERWVNTKSKKTASDGELFVLFLQTFEWKSGMKVIKES